MKIAQIAPVAERVPPDRYGGTERVVYHLTEELVKRGHEVTLFASGDSITSAALASVVPKSLRQKGIPDLPWTLLNVGMAYQRQEEFDIIHDHIAPFSFPTANLAQTPVVATMHGPFYKEPLAFFRAFTRPHLVSISKAQAKGIEGINHAGTVYNGLAMEDYPHEESRDDYLLFVGRMSREKGVHTAIDAANYLGKSLIIAAKIDPVDREYYEKEIVPRLTDRIELAGEVSEERRNELMSGAYCFLHPITWPEPFGLTLIEAMACGCPVVAFGLGSIPEIVKRGVSGFIAEDLKGMIEAIGKIDSIDRAQCRKYALDNFNEKRMADGYEAIYRRLVSI